MRTYVCYGYYFRADNPELSISRKKVLEAESGLGACQWLEKVDGTDKEFFESSFDDEGYSWVLIGVIVDMVQEFEEEWE